MMSGAQRPVLYAGGGIIKAEAAPELRQLAELTGIPVVTTLMARGAFPDGHQQHLGMPGMHGSVAAVGALQKSDLLITLGARFDDRVTGQLASFAPDAQVIHADIAPAGSPRSSPSTSPAAAATTTPGGPSWRGCAAPTPSATTSRPTARWPRST